MIGKTFGNYRATALLGEGGMGAVYLAEHPEIGRQVAIKVLRPEFAGDALLLGRFMNEARAANAIRHPGIIDILDSGTTDAGVAYLVMELLEGESLAARIKRVGALPLRDALEFAYQVASAVGAAHQQGIVHRDLKPDNLFVVPDRNEADRERIKVLDFGIAKLLVQTKGASVKTSTGMLMGTPVYMSPEQCLGTKDVDHRSDMYSLGVILYELLTGRPPFVSEGFGELVNMHLNVAPRPLLQIDPTLPPAVQTTVLRLLAKQPEDRYQSMDEVQRALHDGSGGVAIRVSSSPDLPGRAHPRPAAGRSPLGTDPTTLRSATGQRTGATVRTRSWRPMIAIGGVIGLAIIVAAIASIGKDSAAPQDPVARHLPDALAAAAALPAQNSPPDAAMPAPTTKATTHAPTRGPKQPFKKPFKQPPAPVPEASDPAKL